MKRILQSLALAASLICTGAQATTFATDTSDLWYNPDESGWGVSIVQQHDTLFAVLYVYGSNGQASWFVAPGMPFSGVSPTGTNYTGTLYRTTGSPYGQPFNQSAKTTVVVGAATFTLNSLTTATFTYNIDGVSVTKSITRLTYLTNNMTGNYLGGRVGTYAGCPGGAPSGYVEEPGTWAVQHSSNGAQLVFTGTAAVCTYTGGYAQSGHFGFLSGDFSCNNGQAGTFQAFEINAQITALSARLQSNANNGCAYDGRIAGARRTP